MYERSKASIVQHLWYVNFTDFTEITFFEPIIKQPYPSASEMSSMNEAQQYLYILPDEQSRLDAKAEDLKTAQKDLILHLPMEIQSGEV
jgi:hypothetical protein